jgi:hypothetical protein
MGPLKFGKKLPVFYLISLFFACSSSEESVAQLSISANVIGLKGSNLIITVAGNTTTINASGSITLDGQFAEGSAVSLTISSQPTSPVQLCSFEQASITVQQGATAKVLCQDVVNIDATNYLGVGLRLTDSNGDTVSVLAGSQQGFSTPILPGSSYSISISQESNAPYQLCSLQNGSGTFTSSIPTVTVDCQRFFLLKQVNNSGSASITQMLSFEDGLFFRANDGENGAWFSSGTPSGTAKKLGGILVNPGLISGSALYFNGRNFSGSKDEIFIFQSGVSTQLSNFNDGYMSAASFVNSGETLFFERTVSGQRKLFQYQSSAFSEVASVIGNIPHAVAANGGVYYVKTDGNLAVYLNSQHTNLTAGIAVKELLVATDALYFVYMSSSLYYLGKLNYSNNSHQALNSTGYGGGMEYLTLHDNAIYALALDQSVPQNWRLVKTSSTVSFTEFSTGFSNDGDNSPTKPVSDSSGLYFAALETSKPDTLNQKDLFVMQSDQLTKLVDHGSGVALYNTSEALVSAAGTVYFLAGTAANQLYLYQSQGGAVSTKIAAANQITDITDNQSMAVSGRMLYLPVQTSSVAGIQLYGYLLPP